MKKARLNRTQSIALMAIMSAVYAAVTIALGSLSYYGIQFRVADVLLPFPFILGWPMAVALFIGGFVANIFGGLGAIDMVLGSLLNLAAGILVMNRKTCPHWFLSWLYPTLIIGLGVPAYLQFLVFTPYLLLMPGIVLSTAILCAMGVAIMFGVEKALPQVFVSSKES
ncbi:MAG: QueT transporter family protein [Promethearchaeota archaeon]